MSCWSGHMPRMNEDQLRQACHAYYRAAYHSAWDQAWQSPMNPLKDAIEEPSVNADPSRARSTSLEEARPGDKAGAIDAEFVRVR
jgi:hypothetical protein